VILKWVFGSDLDTPCFCATVANDRDEDLNMLFDVMRNSDAIIFAKGRCGKGQFAGQCSLTNQQRRILMIRIWTRSNS
jgi:hypothetical protein